MYMMLAAQGTQPCNKSALAEHIHLPNETIAELQVSRIQMP